MLIRNFFVAGISVKVERFWLSWMELVFSLLKFLLNTLLLGLIIRYFSYL